MTSGYSISIFWSDEDDSFIALSAEFPGLSAFGKTHADAAQEAEKAIQGMLSIYKEDNEIEPAPKKLPEHSGQFRVRIPRSLHTSLVLEAERQGVSLNTLVSNYLSQAITENGFAKGVQEGINDIKKYIQSTVVISPWHRQYFGSADKDKRIGYHEFKKTTNLTLKQIDSTPIRATLQMESDIRQ